MGLQVRVVHALGQRLIDLPDRTVENPVIIGRSATADIQLPSVSVAPRHCALFIHDGHWAIQDVGNATGTYLNGEPVLEPTWVQIGDKITVGNEAAAPAIEIDPAAAAEGRTGLAGAGLGGVGIAAVSAAGASVFSGVGPLASPPMAPPDYGGGAYGYPPAAPLGYPPGPAGPGYGPPAPPAWSSPAPTDDAQNNGDVVAWGPSNANAASGYRSRRPNDGQNGVMIGVSMVLVVLVIGATIAGVLWKQSHPQVIVKGPTESIQPAEKATSDRNSPGGLTSKNPGAAGTSNVTGPGGATALPTPPVTTPGRSGRPDDAPNPDPGGSSTPAGGNPTSPGQLTKPPAVPQPPAHPATMPAAPGDTEGMDPIDPAPTAPKPSTKAVAGGTSPKVAAPDPVAMLGQTWEAMQQLQQGSDNPARAIFQFEDFRRTNPGKHEAELDQFVDEKLDLIWWDRVTALLKKRDDLEAAAKAAQTEAFDVNDPILKKELLFQIKTSQAEMKNASKLVRETMGYEGDKPPDLSDKAQMERLSQSRDKNKWAAWKRQILFYIKNNHGSLPSI